MFYRKKAVPQTTTEDEIDMNISQEQFNTLIAALNKRNGVSKFWAVVLGGLTVVSIIVGLIVGFCVMSDSIKSNIRDGLTPIQHDVAAIHTDLGSLQLTINGNPNTGSKGMNERLVEIDAHVQAQRDTSDAQGKTLNIIETAVVSKKR
jgi:hypothetical protein